MFNRTRNLEIFLQQSEDRTSHVKKVFLICLTTLILFSHANGDIVDQLTKLNNLYKSGAINENEFSKAKNILLKSEVDEKSDVEEKIPTEKTVENRKNPINAPALLGAFFL